MEDAKLVGLEEITKIDHRFSMSQKWSLVITLGETTAVTNGQLQKLQMNPSSKLTREGSIALSA